jgi:hypothetical protein
MELLQHPLLPLLLLLLAGVLDSRVHTTHPDCSLRVHGQQPS